jgi:hypothetical protein
MAAMPTAAINRVNIPAQRAILLIPCMSFMVGGRGPIIVAGRGGKGEVYALGTDG